MDALPTPDYPAFFQPVTAACVRDASEFWGVHEDILYAVMMVEQGTVGKVSRANKNGTYDIGPMQINSIHLPKLKRRGITEEMLRNDGCLNIEVAASFLAQHLAGKTFRTPQDYLQSIANYHSFTPEFNLRYQTLLMKAFRKLYDYEQPTITE